MTSISSYADLLVVLRTHRLSRGISLLELDDRTGWQSGYAGKVEAWERSIDGTRKANTRGLSVESLFEVVAALGLRLELTSPDDGRADVVMDSRRRAVLEPHLRAWHRRRLKLFTSQTGSAAALL